MRGPDLSRPGCLRLLLSVLTLTFAGLGLPDPARSQGWTLGLYAGSANFESVPGAGSGNVGASAQRSSDSGFFRIGLAAPLASEDVTWGTTAAGERVAYRRGRFVVGSDLALEAHGQRDPESGVWGWGARGEALSVLSASFGPVVAEVRGGRSWYGGESEGEGWSRNLWVSDARLVAVPDPDVRVSGEVRNLRRSREDYTYLGVSGSTATGTGAIWAWLGGWVSGLPEGVSGTAWGVGGSLTVLPATDLWLSVQGEPFDPMFLSDARTSWGIGVSYRVGSARTPPPRAGPAPTTDGSTTIRLPLGSASSPPSVAGDFTSWRPVSMERWGEVWRIDLELEPGVYYYAFRTADGEWFVPEAMTGREEDGMGGWVARLVVP